LSEASLVGFGSAIAVVLLLISLVPIVISLSRACGVTRISDDEHRWARRAAERGGPATRKIRWRQVMPRIPHRAGLIQLFR
jgi:hypothetical protein